MNLNVLHLYHATRKWNWISWFAKDLNSGGEFHIRGGGFLLLHKLLQVKANTQPLENLLKKSFYPTKQHTVTYINTIANLYK